MAKQKEKSFTLPEFGDDYCEELSDILNIVKVRTGVTSNTAAMRGLLPMLRRHAEGVPQGLQEPMESIQVGIRTIQDAVNSMCSLHRAGIIAKEKELLDRIEGADKARDLAQAMADEAEEVNLSLKAQVKGLEEAIDKTKAEAAAQGEKAGKRIAELEESLKAQEDAAKAREAELTGRIGEMKEEMERLRRETAEARELRETVQSLQTIIAELTGTK